MFKSLIRGFLAATMLVASFVTTSIYLDEQSSITPRSYVEKLYQKSGGSGSAVVIAPGLVLTAAHVAINDNLLINGKPTKVIKIDQKKDLALLIASVDCPCASLGEDVNLDDEVLAVGWPLGHLEMATKGRVQGWMDGLVLTNSTIAPGNSGGGLFAFQESKWKLVGVTIQVAGMGWDFGFGLPVLHMVRSVPIQTVKDFIGYDLER
jgi:S1-C subfamily serine protease